MSAREVAGFLKPPTVHCAAPEVLRLGAGGVSRRPKTCPTFTGQRDVVPLGRVRASSGERIVGLRLEDSFFTYTAGRSRWGKTELAITQFLHLVRCRARRAVPGPAPGRDRARSRAASPSRELRQPDHRA